MKVNQNDITFGNQSWTLFLTDLLQDFFNDNKTHLEGVFLEMSEMCSHLSQAEHFKSLEILNYYLCIAIDTDKKEVFLGTQKLSQEIFLAKLTKDEELNKFIFRVEQIKSKSLSSIYETSFQGKLSLKELNINNDGKLALNKLSHSMSEYSYNLFEKGSNFFLGLTANYSLIRVHILKFIAVLSCLDHDKEGAEVKRLFLESLNRLLADKAALKEEVELPLWLNALIRLISIFAYFIPYKLLARLIRYSTTMVAKRFIAGEDINDARSVLTELKLSGREASIDQLGELVLTRSEALDYKNKVLEIIEGLSHIYEKGERNQAGILKAQISIKISALAWDFNANEFQYSYEQIHQSLQEIFRACQKFEVSLNIDAEHFYYRDIVWEIYRLTLSEDEFQNFQDTGIVVQAYLKDAYDHLDEIIKFCEKQKRIMPIRLVKGAYWDAEVVETQAHSKNSYQFLNKVETDIHFRQLVKVLLKNPSTRLCLASHNIYDHVFAQGLRESDFPDSFVIEHQCLHMTYEALSVSMSKLGWCVRNYVPIGNLLVGMSYLVRRIMENSSQVGFLTQARNIENLQLEDTIESKVSETSFELGYNCELSANFFNTAPLDLFEKKTKQRMFEVFQDVNENTLSWFPEGNCTVKSPNSLEQIGQIDFHPKEDATALIDLAYQSFCDLDWAKDFNQRALALLMCAEKLKQRRDLFASLIVIESGKTFPESYADVDEAIDFINFYVRQQDELEHKYNKIPMGVSIVIAPWNFPLAIACGMSVASLISGNSVILKSSEKTPLVVEHFVKLAHECLVPKNVFIHAPGEGAEIGASLCADDRVGNIVFTGSKKVGTELFNTYSNKLYRHAWSGELKKKRVVTEMGGKNAIIISNNCEMDETISGVIYSAFAHAGQKCSACSRVFVHEEIKEKFLNRLKSAVKELVLERSDKLSSFVNPLISSDEKNRVLKQIENIKSTLLKIKGAIVIDRSLESEHESLVGPFIFETTINHQQEIFLQEYFAPIVHVMGFSSYEELLKEVNGSEYALTAGIFSQSFSEIEFLEKRVEAGNIYVNRACTGARVGIEPFGGFKMSGSGPKAGGINYLAAFQIKTQFIGKSVSLQKNWSNVDIPGQVNSSSVENYFEKVILLQEGEKLSLESSKIISLAKEMGVDVEKVSRNYLKALNEQDYDLILVDGGEGFYRKFEAYFPGEKHNSLIHCIWSQSLQLFSDEDYLNALSNLNSFAVNTMRHGAPLELN